LKQADTIQKKQETKQDEGQEILAMQKTGAKGDSYYGRVAQNYEKRRKKQEWWDVEQSEMKSLLETLPEGFSVVDIPFGTGRFVPYYLERQFDISGLDASIEMLNAASQSLGSNLQKCRVSTGSAMDLPFADEQFDLLVSTRFLRDIIVAKDALKALDEFARVTKQFAIIQLGESISTDGEEIDPDHILESRMSDKDNKKMLKDAGFKIVEKRLVKTDKDMNSQIFHFLVKKI
jgi:ubiquinone/menaquinone biosynthesis C-methylase UbiE